MRAKGNVETARCPGRVRHLFVRIIWQLPRVVQAESAVEATARSQGTWRASNQRDRGQFGRIRIGPTPEIILLYIECCWIKSSTWKGQRKGSFSNAFFYTEAVLWIRIRWIGMFLGLLDPDPDTLVRGTEYRSFYHQAKIVRKTLIPTVLWLPNDFLS
jgi:hypothetical protein